MVGFMLMISYMVMFLSNHEGDQALPGAPEDAEIFHVAVLKDGVFRVVNKLLPPEPASTPPDPPNLQA